MPVDVSQRMVMLVVGTGMGWSFSDVEVVVGASSWCYAVARS